MTTPADWSAMLSQIRDLETALFLERFVQFQRTYLESQMTQLDEVLKQVQEQARKLGGGQQSS